MQKSNISQSTAGLLAFIGLLASVPTNIFIGSMAALFSRWQVKKLTVPFVGSLQSICFEKILVALLEHATDSFIDI